METKINKLTKDIKINRIIILITGVITLMLTSFIVVLFVKGLNDDTWTCDQSYRHELELDYWHTKAELVDEVQNYITVNAPESDLSAIVLVDQCISYGVDIKFVMVQGLIESHFGTKGLARRTNSVWNVGAYDNLTESSINGVYKYKHPDHSVKPYLELLTSRYLVNKSEEDLLENFVDSNGNRYASYQHYESELRIKLGELEGSKLDSLVNHMHKMKLRLDR